MRTIISTIGVPVEKGESGSASRVLALIRGKNGWAERAMVMYGAELTRCWTSKTPWVTEEVEAPIMKIDTEAFREGKGTDFKD